MSILKTKGLTAGYGKKIVVNDVNIIVEPGHIVTLIGPNGAGKSTVLKSIIKQLKPVSGVVELNGNDILNLKNKAVAEKIAIVLTERPRPELMTCREVVATGRFPYTGQMGILRESDWKKVDEALARLNSSELANCLFSEISDGQRQRIMLARAICQEPEILVLDEPTMYLDVHFKQELLTVILDVAKRMNIAVIMSLHEIDLAMKISDELVVVDDKKIVMQDIPDRIYASGVLNEIYGMDSSYNPLIGSLYLKGAEGKSRVFVIGGNGTGIPVYYRLQRQGISFAAGILSENDCEYEIAKAMATEVISEKAFYPITEERLEMAKKVLESCEGWICTLKEFGPFNEANNELVRYAKARGIEEWQK